MIGGWGHANQKPIMEMGSGVSATRRGMAGWKALAHRNVRAQLDALADRNVREGTTDDE
jgi:hypothetical protein